jgi:hypothetical protein
MENVIIFALTADTWEGESGGSASLKQKLDIGLCPDCYDA